nr:RES domain-containing protein [uncultured Halomonas sp.]
MKLEGLGFRYQGFVFRGHDPKWAFAPESGGGAAKRGGRWNPIGLPALYTSERFETAWLECQQGFPFKTQPLTLCTYAVDCEPLLDLCDEDVQERLGYPLTRWLDEDWLGKHRARQPVVSWTIVADLLGAGFAGIRVPSRAHGATQRDINIVFWRWSNKPPQQVTIIDDFGRLTPP